MGRGRRGDDYAVCKSNSLLTSCISCSLIIGLLIHLPIFFFGKGRGLRDQVEF